MNGSSGADQARCTIIVPARNAADTIVETLASLRAQTVNLWRAVVVDDGSSDETAATVCRIAADDSRIGMIPGPQRGVGAARNAGLRAATSPFVSFLDADDLLAPAFLAHMIPPLETDASTDATYTGWLRLAADGSTEEGPIPNVDGDLFERFAAACIFPPHACVVRRSLVDEVGGFDEAPSTTEDWDLWLRLARTGARFVRVPGSLVVYRMRAGSRSRDSRRVLDDGLAVIARGHAPDPRVRRPHPSHQSGMPLSGFPRNAYNHLSWAVGMAIASGEDPAPLFDRVAGLTALDLDPWELGGTVLESMRVTLCAAPAAAIGILTTLREKLLVWLDAIESASGSAGIAGRTASAIEQLALQRAAADYPCMLLTSYAVAIDLGAPLATITGVPAQANQVRALLSYDGAPLGDIELPADDGRVDLPLVADAAANAFGWQLLRQFLYRTVFPTLHLELAGERLRVRRNGVLIGEVEAAERPDDSALFEAVGWTVFVQELFGMSDCPSSAIYAASESEHDTPIRLDHPLLECDISTPLRAVQSDTSTVVVRCRIGAAVLSDVTVQTTGGIIEAGTIRRAIADTRPNETVRLAAREGIIDWPVQDGIALSARFAIRSAARPTRSTPLDLPAQ
jgi:hypothetical protein